MKQNEHYKDILKIFDTLRYSRDSWEIFVDFLELSATCISNTVDPMYFDEREKSYLATIKKYIPEHQKLFPEMFAKLVLALEHEYQSGGFVDILGNLFHELELHNKYRGQFFTPQHICTMMGKMLLGDSDNAIKEQGFITVAEPACGSGAMVLGFAQAMKDCGYNHSNQMYVVATDIDLKCVHMCYLQLALYGIPAVVTHGNSLTLEEWSRWHTPVYIFGGWRWKSRRSIISSDKKFDEAQAHNEEQTAEEVEMIEDVQPKIILPTHKEAVKTFEQLDLFTIFGGEGK